jgi:hypothetical protein
MLRCSQTSRPLRILPTQFSRAANLARHMDLLAGCPCATEALSKKVNHEKARRQGGIATFRNRQFHHHSRDQYADRFGWILDELQDKPGYSASWLLCKLTVPAAAPSLPHRTMGGSSAGSMAPSPATTEAATPSPSLAHRSTSARSYPIHHIEPWGGVPKG